jgi:GNAT superfamily N-acetyltransferase
LADLHGEYDIIHYRPEFKLQVVDLLQILWGHDLDSNLGYFRWKYEANPAAEFPLGIVALYQGRPVGFRGYFAVRFRIDGAGERITILFPGDTCVHPDHRRLGLSVAMGNLAMSQYAPAYPFFLNMTCNKESLPGYLRLGFRPLAQKAYLTKHSFLGLVRYLGAGKHIAPLAATRMRLGESGEILVTDAARPEEMAALPAEGDGGDRKIRLCQDESFFRWRFSSGRRRYLFYYLMAGDVTVGYVVMGVSRNNRRATILDYSEGNRPAVGQILSEVIRARHFDLLSIYRFSLDGGWLKTLKGLGFRVNSLARCIDKALHGELPVLIRPVKQCYSEADFLVQGIDLARIENWSLKPICSDAA